MDQEIVASWRDAVEPDAAHAADVETPPLRVLQATVDAISSLHDIDQLVPGVLRVAASALQMEEGALWEHFPGEPMRLRYWVRGGQVLRPEELQELEGEYAALIRTWAKGFRLRAGGPVELDAFLVAKGLSLALNMPLLSAGESHGTLLIFRPTTRPYTDDEVRWARYVACQMSVAIHLGRIASRTRMATMQRERLATLDRANDALRRTADKLAEVPALEAFLEQVLKSLVDTFQGSGGSLWWGDEHAVTLSLELAHGVPTRTPSGTHHDAACLEALLLESHDAARRIRAGLITVLDAKSVASSRASRDWIRSHGIKSLLIVPLMLGERHFGCISVRLSEAHTLGDEEMELAKALATQAALAMELTRLAEEAKHKTTAEAKSAELAKANEALRSTLDVFATGAETDVALGHALRAITEQLVGSSGTGGLWLMPEESGGARLHLAMEEGCSISAERSHLPAAWGPHAVTGGPTCAERLRNGTSSFVQVATLDPMLAGDLEARGLAGLVALPMTLRTRVLGFFVVFVAKGAPKPTCDRVQVGQALAHQATLILQLTRFAEQAKTAAVASERESAVLVRVAKLTQGNAALKRSLDVLASDAHLDCFLGGLLEEIAKRLGAGRVVLCLEGEGGQLLKRLAWDQVVGVQKNIDNLLGPAAAKALLNAAHALRTRRLPMVQPIVSGEGYSGYSEDQAHALHAAGVEAILHLPLVLGERLLGAVAVLLSTPESPSSEDLELAHAFAHQATLALHLARLSSESRGAAILQERARLAREIHDGIVQSFIGIGMQLNRLRAFETPGALEKALELAEHGLAEARRAIRALQPLHLAGKAFVEAVTDMARNSVGEGVTVDVTSSGTWEGLTADAEGHLFRIVQEAVNNVVRHADASELSVELSATGTEVSVLVSDNGKGFDVKAHQDAEHGFGLFSMRQRADSIGAAFTIVSTRGRGTQVYTSLPRGTGGAGSPQ